MISGVTIGLQDRWWKINPVSNNVQFQRIFPEKNHRIQIKSIILQWKYYEHVYNHVQ